MDETFKPRRPPTLTPTMAAAQDRIAAVQPDAYARTRNALDGAVSHLSPYITHGFISLVDVLAGVTTRHALDAQHKFVYEIGWRAYFRHVWQHRGDGILQSLQEGLLPDDAYARDMPADIRQGDTRQGDTRVPVVDEAVRVLYATGLLHNHARMWLASYIVHVRKVHWRVAADWLYGHLVDGDLASNHLSWQWVAATGSSKPYLFNADNVARHAPEPWHSPGSVIDVSYEALDRMARDPAQRGLGKPHVLDGSRSIEPCLVAEPPADMNATSPDAAAVAGRDVWLVHPWHLDDLPAALLVDTLVVGVFVTDFHRVWPWSERRWDFVSRRMVELTSLHWHGDAGAIGAALKTARNVRCIDEPHLAPWLTDWATCEAAPALFPSIDRRCDSFSKWRKHASRELNPAAGLLPARDIVRSEP